MQEDVILKVFCVMICVLFYVICYVFKTLGKKELVTMNN